MDSLFTNIAALHRRVTGLRSLSNVADEEQADGLREPLNALEAAVQATERHAADALEALSSLA